MCVPWDRALRRFGERTSKHIANASERSSGDCRTPYKTDIYVRNSSINYYYRYYNSTINTATTTTTTTPTTTAAAILTTTTTAATFTSTTTALTTTTAFSVMKFNYL